MRRIALASVTAVILCLAVGGFSSTSRGENRGGRARVGTRAPERVATVASSLSDCTMAEPRSRATIEVRIQDAQDFCELVSQALGQTVFRSPLLVAPNQLWHYAGSKLSCLLQFGHTTDRVTVRDSKASCNWIIRLSPRWHPIDNKFSLTVIK
jgi:hypothetical protein